MRNNERTVRPNTTPVVLGCPTGCTWQIMSDSATVAGLEQATHRITAHATLPERRQVQHLITAYRQILGDLPEHVIEISDAAIALSVWLDQTEPGHQGVITLPDGQMLAWHEAEGWTLWDAHGISAPLGVAIDATPAQVAARI